MLPQCLKFVFALTFCFQMTEQISRVDNRAFYVDDLEAAISEGMNTTYIDLLREVFPGASPQEKGRLVARRTIPLRNLEYPRETTKRENSVEISTVQALWIADEGEERLALIINARSDDVSGNSEFNVLAIFRPAPKPQLVDAAEIDFDRFINFWEQSPLLPARQGESAFWIRASHHNSSEGFHSYYLAELRDDRLHLILEEPFSLLDVKICGSEKFQTLKIAREIGSRGGARSFDLRLRTEINPTGKCGEANPDKKRVLNRNYRLIWDNRQKLYRKTILKRVLGKPR